MLRRVLIGVFGAALVTITDAAAQTAQPWSIQLSALGAELTNFTQDDQMRFGGGLELQARYNPSALSIGFGFQTTRHTQELSITTVSRQRTVTYTGAFVEPRYILGSVGDLLAIYLSARFMSLSAKVEVANVEEKIQGAALAGGGGVLVRITSRLNAELGATAGKEYYNRDTAEGTTFVTRLGLAFGL